ncbi:cysteine proteinase [Rozella allomycis CSF55]|uniref:ubiquitinyl hydrolase 1 n=1 Tax=Rozella allomycis (strain CSF55) TaxID=988480 RepID=A0A4P9YH20_ROZAC|nr:cysteine proteinase [Rozella allomycis CSF55]
MEVLIDKIEWSPLVGEKLEFDKLNITLRNGTFSFQERVIPLVNHLKHVFLNAANQAITFSTSGSSASGRFQIVCKNQDDYKIISEWLDSIPRRKRTEKIDLKDVFTPKSASKVNLESRNLSSPSSPMKNLVHKRKVQEVHSLIKKKPITIHTPVSPKRCLRSFYKSDAQLRVEKRGLINPGNWCFINSIMISLFHCQIFKSFAQSMDHRNEGFLHLNKLFSSLETHKISSVVNVRKWVVSKHEQLNNSDQHDAHEFYILLMDDLLEILKCENKIALETFKAKFMISIQKKVECVKCGTFSFSTENSFNLHLPLSNNDTNIQCLFDNYETLTENLENYQCENCNEFTNANLSHKIIHKPDLLALTLNRFEYRNGLLWKNNVAVDPNSLSGYSLGSLIYHIGSTPYSGHYCSLVNIDNKSSLHFSDAECITVENDTQNDCIKNSYIIFYNKI